MCEEGRRRIDGTEEYVESNLTREWDRTTSGGMWEGRKKMGRDIDTNISGKCRMVCRAMYIPY